MRVLILMAVSVGCGLLVTSPSFAEDESVCYEWLGGTGQAQRRRLLPARRYDHPDQGLQGALPRPLECSVVLRSRELKRDRARAAGF